MTMHVFVGRLVDRVLLTDFGQVGESPADWLDDLPMTCVATEI